MNRRLAELLHGDERWLAVPAQAPDHDQTVVVGGISSQEEEAQLAELNTWVADHGLPKGELSYDFADKKTGAQLAVFDLAWPHGVQEELSQPVAVLLNEGNETLAIAGQAGFRFFTSVSGFQEYVEREILGELEQD